MNTKKLLSLWGLKWNPFSPELPAEALPPATPSAPASPASAPCPLGLAPPLLLLLHEEATQMESAAHTASAAYERGKTLCIVPA